MIRGKIHTRFMNGNMSWKFVKVFSVKHDGKGRILLIP